MHPVPLGNGCCSPPPTPLPLLRCDLSALWTWLWKATWTVPAWNVACYWNVRRISERCAVTSSYSSPFARRGPLRVRLEVRLRPGSCRPGRSRPQFMQLCNVQCAVRRPMGDGPTDGWPSRLSSGGKWKHRLGRSDGRMRVRGNGLVPRCFRGREMQGFRGFAWAWDGGERSGVRYKGFSLEWGCVALQLVRCGVGCRYDRCVCVRSG
ncbi:hypothetical protein CALVIDRAFT_194128 [Calocera viscosa TUFC12733]|uniref:Uncharacterized protein n=1 Tax=Calocera viscosa (strain TUFC12733) TaxID=1330018 RepID=A0A167KRL7_CALVF|nr:hypothetical protein CALVIDRAFT_194128 [Calocera viscosa TUFC12733]